MLMRLQPFKGNCHCLVLLLMLLVFPIGLSVNAQDAGREIHGVQHGAAGVSRRAARVDQR